MACKRKHCKAKNSNEIKTQEKKIRWLDYPSSEEKEFGHCKFCYFIACQKSELPIRDYVYERKSEPHYEEKSYNEYAFCNQWGIRNLKEKGVSHIIFVTLYKGTIAKYQNKYYITGWFPISQYKEIPYQKKYNDNGKIIYRSRIAYKSKNPIFLSIEDSIQLNNKKWMKWFGTKLPMNRLIGKPQLNYFTQFLEKEDIAVDEIKNHFKNKKNRINEYVREIKKTIESVGS